MLRVFFGNDTVGVRQAALDFVRQNEKEGVSITYIEKENFQAGILADAAGATSLFGGTELYVIDTPSSDKDFSLAVIDNLSVLRESHNTFVVIEESLLVAQKKPYQKYAGNIEEFKKNKGERFNIFALAGALSQKDKKRLWVLLQEACINGFSAEEIIGTLWWQLKTLRLASLTASAKEAGMKDFTYNKARQALSKFKAGELEKISRDLLTVYHDGHLGKKNIVIALERWVLSL